MMPPVAPPLKTSQRFMQTERSLPCLQDASTDPYPETYQSSLYHFILSLQYPF
jgi:hypothetical protein